MVHLLENKLRYILKVQSYIIIIMFYFVSNHSHPTIRKLGHPNKLHTSSSMTMSLYGDVPVDTLRQQRQTLHGS